MLARPRRLVALKVLSAALKGKTELATQRPNLWTDVCELAMGSGVAPALWGAVHEIRRHVPTDVVDELHKAELHNAVRNARLRRDLDLVVEAMNDVDVVPMPFKGALALVDGTDGAIGGRWMVDLDILVRDEEAAAARTALERLGYAAEPGRPFLHPHELPFVRDGSPGPVELHTVLGSPPIPTVLPASETWAESFEITIDRARARAPAPTHQVLHSVLHSAIQDLNHAVGGLPLRQLLSLRQLVERHGEAIDWTEIWRRMNAHGLSRVLRDHLWLAHRVVGLELPAGPWGLAPRLHEARVLASFAMTWPADVQRNMRFAFGREYMDSLYAHRDRPLHLAVARLRHAVRIARRDRRTAMDDLLMRRE